MKGVLNLWWQQKLDFAFFENITASVKSKIFVSNVSLSSEMFWVISFIPKRTIHCDDWDSEEGSGLLFQCPECHCKYRLEIVKVESKPYIDEIDLYVNHNLVSNFKACLFYIYINIIEFIIDQKNLSNAFVNAFKC